jgi:hypothetical protein
MKSLHHLISVPLSAIVVSLAAWGLLESVEPRDPRELTEVTRGATWVDDARNGLPGARRGRKRDVQAVRRQLERGAYGTYITDVLIEHDSALARWPDRVAKPLRVWVQPDPALEGWNPEFVGQVRTAFNEWVSIGIPMRFRFVDDSADAEVQVTWVDRFDEPISGKTRWARDSRWWIVDGNITIALRHSSGPMLSSGAIHAIALHEVGHLLGLDHSQDPENIMTPRVRVKSLSEADRATMRLLYSLPPGTVR